MYGREPFFPQKFNEGDLPKAKDERNSKTYSIFVVQMPGPNQRKVVTTNYSKKLTSIEVESLKNAGLLCL